MTPTDMAEAMALLDHVAIVVPCRHCDSTYTVPASFVRDSQRVLADGCSGSTLHECDASFYATLIEPDALDALARAWIAFCRSAASHGGSDIILTTREPGGRELDPDARAIQRWENDGGG